MNILIRRRTALKGRITAASNIIDAHEVISLTKIAATNLLEKTDKLVNDNDDIYNLIAERCATDADLLPHQEYYDREDLQLQTMKTVLMEIIQEFTPPPSIVASTISTSSSRDIRLPRLDLPTFSGNRLDWISFHDLFQAAVHNNNQLSGAQKLQYLQTSVKGEAFSLINNFSVSDNNYAQAWKTLQERYQDRRELVSQNFDRLLSIPHLQTENPASLQKMFDRIKECSRTVEILGVPKEKAYELLIIHLVAKKLDSDSRMQWERELKKDTLPTLQDFCEFGDNQARITGAARVTTSSRKFHDQRKQGAVVHHGSSTSSSEANGKASCSLCNEEHILFQCRKFKALTGDERWKHVKNKQLCFNCLSPGHRTTNCKSSHCRNCDKYHHTLLHGGEQQNPNQQQSKREETAVHFASSERRKGMLATALIRIKDNFGGLQLCRALLDPGSESTLVTRSCATRLGLRRQKVDNPMSGLGGVAAGTATDMIELRFSSNYGYEPIFKTQGLILKNITRNIPAVPIPRAHWEHLRGLKLADPYFHEVNKIDVLLGADVYYELVEPGKKTGPAGAPIAIKTSLGWILGGRINDETGQSTSTYMVQCNLDSTLRKFWELEEIPRQKFLTAEEKACEQHFATTHSRNPEGRFIVRLPIKENAKPLGHSRDMAIRRLKSGERKNEANPARQKVYRDVMEEYLKMGHMELVPEIELHQTPVYYMPHHAVENVSSSTTPFRVVCDASAKTSTGVSLNENLMVGPQLQEGLMSNLVRFRKHKNALTADIPKMFRQMLLHREDTDLHRIVWRRSPQDSIKEYRFLTATFGTASAPYMAIKSLQQLAEYEKENFPAAAAVIQRDFYVDDLMTGTDTDEGAISIYEDLMKLLGRGGMSLRKWSSNSPALMSHIPEDLREKAGPLTIEDDSSVKTLGLQWHPAGDYFSFRVSLSTQNSTTKRSILSEIAKVFDPLGWLSPVTISAKMIMQLMWKEEIGWDTELPANLIKKWNNYRQLLPGIEHLRIPRWISQQTPQQQHLHGFSDASESAYAAVVFLRSITSDGNVAVRMVAAKSKVAPVKQVSLPRLELMGSLLLVQLMQNVQESLKISLDGMFGWTDSTIVLAWLASPPQRWKTFVANRVAEIQDFLPRDRWNHVSSADNPADCASRGIIPSDLTDHNLWWQGPKWLRESKFPAPNITTPTNVPEEREPTATLHLTADESFLYRYSNLARLLRVTSYCLRAKDWMRRKKISETLTTYPLKSTIVTTEEIKRALTTWIKLVQRSEFLEEIKILEKRRLLPVGSERDKLSPEELLKVKELEKKLQIPAGSKLQKLSPFLDSDGVVRVGGRLQKSELPIDVKHQIILPKKHHLTNLIIWCQHEKDLHSGPQALLASLQQNYWILAGRDVVRHFVRGCVKCCRFRADNVCQRMGELPAARVTPAAPFERTGVDYAGPYNLTARRGRGQRSFKTYIALFVCMVTRAIHLELVADLTTEAFLAALRRFVSRRGKPCHMYSDCGTNFLGAKRVMEEYQKIISSEGHNLRIQQELANDSITWHFNVPTGAHHGGIWESGVKSMKHHLKRVIGAAVLTMEEMRTLLAQVEAVLNSRPMTELSTDPADLQPLTPGHFLIGRPLTAIAEPGLTHLKECHLSRWQLVQQKFQHFWRRWSREYLSRLQQRNKWTAVQENVPVGSLVLLKDENLPPCKWNLGRITATFPGDDNLVRVVMVKTATSEFRRPITKLSILPIM